ncbi:MAG: DUF1684 domain-containing protein [Bacteroidales bacterium]|nr:DUF1684 domain-containing protein [Bacteroidales bacterium]MCF6342158.1 DUF1684 domain-containing protein [Bacteroidales bacterium]
MHTSSSKKIRTALLFIFILVLIVVVYLLFFMRTDGSELAEDGPAIASYIAGINQSRAEKDAEFADSTRSRFNAEERAVFHGLNYFDPDPYYKISAVFTVDTSSPAFKMPTNTDRKPNYRVFGFIDFTVHGIDCRLTAYQNMDYKDDPEWGGYLFVPFSDKTNGKESYGAGRYLDIPIPGPGSFILDFNEAYNPYCAYSDRWSCPLVPVGNYLEVSIPAGEKKYKH